MKKYALFLLLAAFFLPINLMAQYNGYKDWPRDERAFSGKFFLTDEAMLLADRVMDFQLKSGAWPKNVYYPQLTEDNVSEIKKKFREETLSTVENSATLAEIHFLSNMYQATAQRRFRKAAEQGIDYLLRTQYDNGGWPTCSPAAREEDRQISFAGGTQVNVLLLLNDIIQHKEPYTYLADDLVQQCKDAFGKGVVFILNAQIRQNGQPTIWCAQYGADSHVACAASPMDPVALAPAESATITLLLMGISNPDAVMKAAIEGAVAWFQQAAIKQQKRENYINKDGKRDFRLVTDVHAADMWAKFYGVQDNQPFFTDQDGEQRASFAELSYPRRTGVSWYTNEPQKVLRRYERWKTKTAQ